MLIHSNSTGSGGRTMRVREATIIILAPILLAGCATSASQDGADAR